MTSRHRRDTSAARVTRRSGAVRILVPREERRVQILDAAAELFSRRGFAGTTTREIAAAVGTTETVLFRHFPTKQRLYAAILEHWVPVAHVDRWLDDLRALADARDDEALFRAVVTAILESYRQVPVYHRLMLFAALEDQELARIAQVESTDADQQLSARVRGAASVGGRLPPRPARDRRPHAAQRSSPVRAMESAGREPARPVQSRHRRAGGRAARRLARLRQAGKPSFSVNW